MVDALRALAKEYRENSEYLYSIGNTAAGRAWRSAAEKLEAVLNEGAF